MNISYNWLKEYLNFNLSPEEVSAALTSIGLETDGVEKVETIKGGLEGLVVGKVLTCVEHPDSDHLHITTVDLGDGIPTQIVCGAWLPDSMWLWLPWALNSTMATRNLQSRNQKSAVSSRSE